MHTWWPITLLVNLVSHCSNFVHSYNIPLTYIALWLDVIMNVIGWILAVVTISQTWWKGYKTPFAHGSQIMNNWNNLAIYSYVVMSSCHTVLSWLQHFVATRLGAKLNDNPLWICCWTMIMHAHHKNSWIVATPF